MLLESRVVEYTTLLQLLCNCFRVARGLLIGFRAGSGFFKNMNIGLRADLKKVGSGRVIGLFKARCASIKYALLQVIFNPLLIIQLLLQRANPKQLKRRIMMTKRLTRRRRSRTSVENKKNDARKG